MLPEKFAIQTKGSGTLKQFLCWVKEQYKEDWVGDANPGGYYGIGKGAYNAQYKGNTFCLGYGNTLPAYFVILTLDEWEALKNGKELSINPEIY